jgi:hypothetical protein
MENMVDAWTDVAIARHIKKRINLNLYQGVIYIIHAEEKTRVKK